MWMAAPIVCCIPVPLEHVSFRLRLQTSSHASNYVKPRMRCRAAKAFATHLAQRVPVRVAMQRCRAACEASVNESQFNSVTKLG